MDWFTFFFFYGFVTAIQVILQLSFIGQFTGKALKIRQYILCILLLYLMVLVGTAARSSLLSTLLNMLVLYGASRILLRNKRLISGLSVILTVSIMQLSFGIMNALESMLRPYAGSGTFFPIFMAILFSILSLVLCFCCYHFIACRFTLQKDISNQYISIILSPMLLFLVVGFYILHTAYGNVTVTPFPAEPRKHMELLIMQALGFCAIFSTLYGYRKLGESYKTKARLTLLEQETHAQKTYVAEAKTRYEQTKAFRHDIKNHLSVLDGLLSAGQTEQAKNYLNKLESVTTELSFPVRTGNPVVDILLGSKSELAAQNGIETEISLLLPGPCAIDDFDLCVIFSNAMDNAINACTPISGAKRICITGERQGDFFMLEFVNSCLPDRNAACEYGTGLSNIKAVAEKYSGVITTEIRSAEFCLNVLVNIS